MDDERVWTFEESLWLADPAHYRELIDAECLMVLPAAPFIVTRAAGGGRRVQHAALDQGGVVGATSCPPTGRLIVIAYKAVAERDGIAPYEAHCTSTYRRLEHEVWRVIQHQQTPPLMSGE